MNNQTQTGYQRKVGFFGSVKNLATSTVTGTGLVLNDTVSTATAISGSIADIATVGRQASNIFTANLLEDLEADREIDRIHRQLDSLQQHAELEALKLQLEKARAKNPVGRPANK